MRFVRVLLDEAGDSRPRLVASTIAAGISMGAVMAVVNTVSDNAKTEGIQLELLAWFIVGCAGFLLTKGYALNTTVRIVEAYIDRLRMRFAERIARADLASFERIGRSRIHTVLTRDVQVLSEAGTMVVHGASSAVMLTFSALYIAYLSLLAFGITLVLFGSAVYFYKRSQQTSAMLWRRALDSEAEFNRGLGHLLDGFKEVKMDSRRREDLIENHLADRSRMSEALKIESSRRFNSGTNITNLFFYLLMGTMVFALPQNVDSGQTAAKVINVIIFVGASIEIVLKALPMLAKSNLAIANLTQLETDLDEAARTADHPPSPRRPRAMSRIEGRALAYTYSEDGNGGRTFSVGPCDITVQAGEILFIVGGNGSGKSTLVRLLAHLYESQGGGLFWDGVVVDRRNAADYRNLFSVIFADFHLFDRLYGIDEPGAERVSELLAEMELDRKTGYADRHFTSLDLSTGQRKRLAMIAARLEDKPICIFDEWAADQDPVFRRYFYEVLLPSLRAEGRTVIAVTHDDRYFSAADRVLVMEEGRIIREESHR